MNARTPLRDYADAQPCTGRDALERSKGGHTKLETEAGSAVDGMRVFLNAIARTRLLTPAEEVTLAKAVERGDRAARRRLVEANLRFVVAIARQYTNCGLPLEDLVQEGAIGLDHAAQKFDWRRGHRFSTYAYWWIRQAIQRALTNQSRLIRLPGHVEQRREQLVRMEQALEAELQRPPMEAELAQRMGLRAEELMALRALPQAPLALDRPTRPDDRDGVAARTADPNAVDPVRNLERAEARADADRMLRKLSVRERQVVEAHFGLREPALPLAEVAHRMGITSERARQIEGRALDRLAFVEAAPPRPQTPDRRATWAGSRDRRPARGDRRVSRSALVEPRVRG